MSKLFTPRFSSHNTDKKFRKKIIFWKISIAYQYVCRYEWQHPIVLIGHSFGGLVLKSLVVKLKTMRSIGDSYWKATAKRGKEFLRNVRGVAFYAVPHAGSSNISKYLNKLLRSNNRRNPGIVDNTLPGQRDMEQLSVDFDDIVNENKINIYAFCEGRPMEQVVCICLK
jgi:triacylglycerol esterase/lipase EstA (alpha/beta hydrolase family)